MQIARNKTMATLIALFLVLTITVTLVALPSANAHTPAWTVSVWCLAGVTPRTIGINQEALIVFWCNVIPPTTSGDSRYGDRWIFYADVTKPDGSTETLGPFTSDPVGGSYTLYTPTQLGTYTIVARMPAFKLTGLPSATGVPSTNAYVNDTFGPATSEPVYLIVQQEPIQSWQESPLPSGYWTRPINTASREWSVLAGNWLGGAAQSPAGAAGGTTATFGYSLGPESAHILWTKPYYAGGIMDERFGNIGYETSHYQGINLGNPIIIQGKLIVVNRNTAHTTSGWLVIDLYTGETLSFENDTTIPAFGQIYNYESPNQHGGFPYLWRTSGVLLPPNTTSTTTWELLDGYTLQSITKIANVSSGGTAVYGKDGSILRYSLSTTAGVQRLLVWNSSAIPSELLGTTGTNFWQWRPAGQAVHDGRNGFSLNVSISLAVQGSILAVREGQYVIGGTSGKNNGTYLLQGNLWALNLNPAKGAMGTLLWNRTFTPPQQTADDASAGQQSAGTISMTGVYPDDGVILFEQKATRQRWGYSLETGQLLWTGKPEEQFNYYGMSDNVYEGKFFSYGYGGQLRAYNITTGAILWTCNATTVGFESPYGGYYPIGIACIADGKLYTVSSEHSPTQPLYRGPNLRCIDAETGEELWSTLFWGARMSPSEPNVYIADGIIIGLNYYDMQIYAFGKGSSATTVSAPQTFPSLGSSVMITGTVTDDTPTGRRNTNGVLDFALKGTPAISDADQSAWMEYLFQQQAMPSNAKGVNVTLDAIDPNGNFIHIGTATSDITGAFGYAFTPEVPGTYQIIATFAGSASYGSSFAETYMGVGEAPPAVAEPQPAAPLPPFEMYTLYATIAIIIAIAIVGLLLLRKK